MLFCGHFRMPEALAAAGKKGGLLWWHSPAHELTDTGFGIATTALGADIPPPLATAALCLCASAYRTLECLTNAALVSTPNSPSSLLSQRLTSSQLTFPWLTTWDLSEEPLSTAIHLCCHPPPPPCGLSH